MRFLAGWLAVATCHGLTPAQRDVIDTARHSSLDATRKAEKELLAPWSPTWSWIDSKSSIVLAYVGEKKNTVLQSQL